MLQFVNKHYKALSRSGLLRREMGNFQQLDYLLLVPRDMGNVAVDKLQKIDSGLISYRENTLVLSKPEISKKN